MAKSVALVETSPSRVNYSEYFPFEFDQYSLCSDPSIKKVLKKDCDIDIDLDKYDFVLLIGATPFKYFTKFSSVTDYSGKLVNRKFLPIISPLLLTFKPENKPLWDASLESICGYIVDGKSTESMDSITLLGLDTTHEINDYLHKVIASDATYIGLDSEATALYPRDGYVLGISIAYLPNEGAYLDSLAFDEETERLLQVILDTKIPILHNSKYDISMLEYHFNLKFGYVEDTMLMHYVLDERPGTHGLKQLALRHSPYGDYERDLRDWIEDYCKRNKVLKSEFDWSVIPFEVMVPYAAGDAVVTLYLFHKLNVLRKNPKLTYVYEKLLLEGSTFLRKVQENGVPFSKERLQFVQAKLEKDLENSFNELRKTEEVARFEELQQAEFNANSVIQLRKLLFDFLGLKPTGKKTATGKHSTDAEVLEELGQEHHVPKLILDIRKKTKIKNTYIDKIIPQLDRDSRLRTNYNLHGTTSGRLSSSGKLNMQQLPRDDPSVKGCIKAREGYKIVSLDLKTAEVYVASVLSGDKSLQEVFTSGGDFHSTIAKKVFRLPCTVDEVKGLYPEYRQMAKAITFGIMYQAGPPKIAAQITKDSGKFFSDTQASEIIAEYFAEFSGLAKWIDKVKKFISINEFTYSFFGRKRRLKDVSSSDRATKSHAIRSGLNFEVQSPASDVTLLGGIETQKEIEEKQLDAYIFGLVHDSILAEVKTEIVEEYCEIVTRCVQRDRGLSIPGCPIQVDIEIGDDYSFEKFEKLYGTDI